MSLVGPRPGLFNQEQLLRASPTGHDADYEAVLNSYELAWRMQNNAPEALDISNESEDTKKMYGIDEKLTDNFGRQCLMCIDEDNVPHKLSIASSLKRCAELQADKSRFK